LVSNANVQVSDQATDQIDKEIKSIIPN